MKAFALLLALAATPALADCPSFGTTPVESFHEVNARPGVYVMAVGRFANGAVVDEIYALATDGSETSTRLIAGRFQGMKAIPEGFTEPLDAEVLIAQRCGTAGCHPLLGETRYLVFLQQVRGRLEFGEDGCAFRAYADPAPEALEAMIGCLNGACE